MAGCFQSDRRALSTAPGIGLFFDGSAEFGAGFEFHDFFSRDFDRCTGTGVAAGTSRFFGHAERAEAYESDFFASFEGFARHGDEGFEGFLSLYF